MDQLTNDKKWYVGAMNDGLFVIDAPPRPSTDDITQQPNVNVIVALGTNREAADILVAEHNERIKAAVVVKGEAGPDDKARALDVVAGCSNWFDIEHYIVPRVIAALATVRAETTTAMRDKCVETVKSIHEGRLKDLPSLVEKGEVENEDAEYERAVLFVLSNVIDAIRSLTLDQVKPGEM